MKISKIISLIFSFIVTLSVHSATVVIEPMLKYQASGDVQLLDQTYGLTKSEGTLGLGVQHKNTILRLDFTGNLLSITTPDGETSESFYGYSLGTVLGKSWFDNNVRIWAGYVPLSHVVSSLDSSTYKGSGYNLGLSFTIYKPIHFLVEYKAETFTKRILSNGTSTTLEGNQQLVSSSIFVGLSLPWIF